MAGVASAAIVSGELILGLDDGQIIRAGYVQGPQGLTGDRGAIGSVGPAGRDGNGLLHGAGVPTFDDGKDGDFYIDIKEWKAYGPKTGGKWGSGVALLPKDRGGMLPTGMRTQGSVSAGSRAFAASMGGPGGGGGIPAPTGDGLDLINGHNKPLAANINSIIASDTKGDAMHVLVKADAATGSWYGEVVVTHFGPQADYTVAWEVNIGTAPKITFAPVWNVDHLDLGLSSSVALTNLRGKIIFV
jgi:hypothetical protein